MNLNERGITVGDLVLIVIIVISTVFIINKVKDANKQASFQMPSDEFLIAKKS